MTALGFILIAAAVFWGLLTFHLVLWAMGVLA
jgi:hypothetical protein